MPLNAPISQRGRLDLILVSPRPKATLVQPDAVDAIAGLGLEGDHRSRGKPGRRRQVTLLQAEHLTALGMLLGRGPVDPVDLRRNLVISGFPIAALGRRRLLIGAVVLELTGPCDPCARVEAALGPGAEAAAVGLAGWTARVICGGALRVGATVTLAAAP